MTHVARAGTSRPVRTAVQELVGGVGGEMGSVPGVPLLPAFNARKQRWIAASRGAHKRDVTTQHTRRGGGSSSGTPVCLGSAVWRGAHQLLSALNSRLLFTRSRAIELKLSRICKAKASYRLGKTHAVG